MDDWEGVSKKEMASSETLYFSKNKQKDNSIIHSIIKNSICHISQQQSHEYRPWKPSYPWSLEHSRDHHSYGCNFISIRNYSVCNWKIAWNSNVENSRVRASKNILLWSSNNWYKNSKWLLLLILMHSRLSYFCI